MELGISKALLVGSFFNGSFSWTICMLYSSSLYFPLQKAYNLVVEKIDKNPE
ncbi:hypothetical protein FTV88_2275 [Heliorestis convoluta]|uniref:Uncharacterized protein n=1 Tax=Heliorestis convoluta TaxID=356322 RepID=A0A5Q2N3C9_9FIRM|nr:hypothetical protein FTV88_2275 [Heliorestis convoluta]